MRKLSFVVLAMALVAFVASPAFAQDEKPYYFGVKAGLNVSHPWGCDRIVLVPGGTWAIGASGGAFMEYMWKENFHLMPEVMFMWRGSKQTSELEDGSTQDIALNFYYVDINLLGKAEIPFEGTVTPYVFFGPYVGIKVSEAWSADPDLTEEDGDFVDETVLEKLKPVDVGMLFGCGFDYGLENGHKILVEARYGLGFLKIFEEREWEEEAPDFGNQVINLSVGYAF
jgi:hypothetical protein